MVAKSRNLNFLDPSGPIQASNGTALNLPLSFVVYITVILSIIEIELFTILVRKTTVPIVSG